MEEKSIQVSFETHVWKSPDGSFNYSLAIIDLECRLDGAGGIVILTNTDRSTASAFEVSSLQKDLRGLLNKAEEDVVVYWRIEDDPQERAAVLSKLTHKPIYFG